MDAIKRQMKRTVHTHFEIFQNDPFSAADRGYKVAMNLSITLRSISRSISFSWVVCCYLGKLVRLLALNSLALMFLMTNCCRQRQRRRRREKFFFPLGNLVCIKFQGALRQGPSPPPALQAFKVTKTFADKFVAKVNCPLEIP